MNSEEENGQDCGMSSMMMPEYKKGYSLLFGSSHFYIVFKMVSTIYERLMKARQLINEKVNDDMAKESVKAVFKLENGDRVSDEVFAKFKKELIEERFEIFTSAVIGTLS